MTHEGILIIDDNPDIRATLQDLFELEGYRVRTADNGLTGLEALRTSLPPCMILLDLMMPVMDGWEFLQRLRALDDAQMATTSVTVLSGAGSRDELDQLEQRYGCVALSKPADVGRLLEVTHGCCDGRAGTAV